MNDARSNVGEGEVDDVGSGNAADDIVFANSLSVLVNQADRALTFHREDDRSAYRCESRCSMDSDSFGSMLPCVREGGDV